MEGHMKRRTITSPSPACGGGLGRGRIARRTILAGFIAAVLAALPLASLAQERLPVVAWCCGNSADDNLQVDRFVLAMAEAGYAEGRDFILVQRFHGGDRTLTPGLVEELVALNPDVILTGGTSASILAAAATSSIPAFANFNEDTAVQIVGENFANPPGNVTGFINNSLGRTEKQLEVLVDAFPWAQRIGVLRRSGNVVSAGLEEAGEALGKEIVISEFDTNVDLGAALDVLSFEGVDAVVATSSIPRGALAEQTLEWAAAEGVPVVYYYSDPVEAGGLMSYGVDVSGRPQIRVEYVLRILDGASPSDLPLRFAPNILVINLNTARDLGVEFPANILAFADVVIE